MDLFQRIFDIVTPFYRVRDDCAELRFTLRSVARNLPFVRKVWIFGDRPDWLAADRSVIEHVSHGYLAPLLGIEEPVRNDFRLQLLASLIPGLAFDFLRIDDDQIVLEPLSPDDFSYPRALEDMSQFRERGQGAWQEQLWRSYDMLRRYGYSGINFESHVPQPYTKQMVLEGYLAFSEFITAERYRGIVAPTAIYNYGGVAWFKILVAGWHASGYWCHARLWACGIEFGLHGHALGECGLGWILPAGWHCRALFWVALTCQCGQQVRCPLGIELQAGFWQDDNP